MATEENHGDSDFCSAMDDMTKGISSVREVVQELMKTPVSETKDGISLLSLKHQLLLSYIHSLTLVMAHRVLGHSLIFRTRPRQPFTDTNREVRGAEAGDLVDTLVEDRIILEKIKQLESKMRYQIEKLVRIAEEDATGVQGDVVNDPLAFKPNPENLLDRIDSGSDSGTEKVTKEGDRAIYRPPRLAPMPYTEGKAKSKRPVPAPAGLTALAHLNGSNPHVESSSGLGSMPSMGSARARELVRMNEFEEENMTRLVMTKKEARRRLRDEEDVALGGTGASKGRRRGGGLEDEFRDVLRAVDRSGRSAGMDDGYEALRVKGQRQDALTRSKAKRREDDDDADSGRVRKKSRFLAAVKVMSRKQRRT